MWSLENVWRIVVVAASATGADTAAAASVVATASKRKTRMNNWIRCKFFYSTQITGDWVRVLILLVEIVMTSYIPSNESANNHD